MMEQAAINTLMNLGYTYHGGELWKPPIGEAPDFDLIDSLRARIEALEKDAARYRWLRDNNWNNPNLRVIITMQMNAKWDAAIDTAMQSAQKVNRREIERKITEEDNKRLMYVDPNDDRFSL